MEPLRTQAKCLIGKKRGWMVWDASQFALRRTSQFALRTSQFTVGQMDT